MRSYLLFAFVGLALSGCALWQKGKIKAHGITVAGVPDAGKAATLDSDTSVASLPIPAGSTLTLTKFEAMRATPATETTPEVKAQPAREVTEIVLSKPTEWRKNETRVHADTGTADTSIAQHRIDVAENRYLLFAALGASVAAGFFLYIKYPTPAMICASASIVFFLAWKLSDLPSWFYVVGVAALVGAFALWRGHEKGEVHATAAILGTPTVTTTAQVTAPKPSES